jgi:hypothetical protein
MPDWQKASELRLLREITFYYMISSSGSRGLNVADLLKDIRPELPEEIRLQVDRWDLGIGTKPAIYDSLTRFLHFESLRPRSGQNVLHDALFRHVVGWLLSHQDTAKVKKSQFLNKIKAKTHDWFSVIGKQAPEAADPPSFDHELLPLIEEFLKIDFAASSKAASVQLTGRELGQGDRAGATESQGYETYRYSERPGRVVRTFTLFTPPTPAWPFCSFENIYKNAQGRDAKHSLGIALKLEHGIYCIGRLHGSNNNTTSGLKIIALPNQVWSADILHGLMVTRDEGGRLLVARTALKRSDATTLEQGNPTVVPFEQVSSTIDDDIIRRIRNTIGFEIGRLIFSKEKNRHINAQNMVEFVAELCGEKLTVGDLPFNPASHSFYPFNQALLAYGGDEEYVGWSTVSAAPKGDEPAR